ncbi:MAG: manganese efflux pump [bacterium]|nr:manganese efflux pump [bacterium]
MINLDPFIVLGVAVGLAMDAFAVSIASAVMLGRASQRQVFRFAWHFGLFQSGMLFLGWLAGNTVAPYIKVWDHWVAFALLLVIGARAIAESMTHESARPRFDPTRGWSLVILSVATSIDALAVGLSFAALGENIGMTTAVVGLTAAVFSALGMLAGARLGERFGRQMERVGGVVLIFIGVKILAEHLLNS